LVLAAVVAIAVMGVVVVAGLSSLLLLSTPASIHGVVRVTVITEAVMYRG
jgi:hypothetical protein